MKKLLLIFAALCGFFYSAIVFAVTPMGGFTQGISSTGQSVFYAPTGYGVKTNEGMGRFIWNSAVSPSKNSVGTWSGSLPFGTAKAAVGMKGVLTAGAVFSTFKTIAGGPVGIGIAAITTLPAIIDWLASGGVRVASTGGYEKSDPTVCTVAPCSQYQINDTSNAGPVTGWSNTKEGAAREFASAWNSMYPCVPNYPRKKLTFLSVVGTTANFTAQNVAATTCALTPAVDVGKSLLSRPIDPAQATWAPASIEDIRAQMENTPSTSAAIDALVGRGGVIPISYAPSDGAVPASGPPSVSEVPVIASKTDGDVTTKTTTTKKTDVTYGEGADPATGKTVPTVTGTTNTTINVTTTNNVTGAVTTNNTTTNNPAPPAAEPAEDPCKANPNRAGCLDVDTPDGEIPKSSKTITYAEESVFGGGSCPANLTSNIATLGKTVTVWDWQKTCDMALPLRALILSLATFAAFLIVMPGGNKS